MRTSSRLVVTGVVAAVTAALVASAATAPRLSDFEPSPDDAFAIDMFDQEVRVGSDGRLEVVESIDVTFREQRRGIFRDLDTVGIEDSQVTYEVRSVDRGLPDQSWDYVIEDTGARLRVRIGNEDVVLDPGPQHYRIAYVMDGLLFEPTARPGMVQLRIDVPGAEWPTAIAETRFRVELPAEPTRVQCVMGSSGETNPCPEATVEGTTVRQSVPALEPWTTATVLVEVPADAFTTTFDVAEVEDLDTLGEAAQPEGPPPLPRVPAALLLLLLVAAPALLLEALRARLVYRDRVTDPALHDRVTPSAELEPPDNARPLETAALLQRGIGNEVVLATLLDLELRGAVQTATTETAEGKPRIVVTPADGAPRGEPPRPWEAAFLRHLLGSTGRIDFDGVYDADTTKRASAASGALKSHGGWLHSTESPLTHTGARWLRGGTFAVWIALCLALGAVIGVAGTRLLQLSLVVPVVIWVCLGVSWILLSFVWRPQRLPLTSVGRDVIARTRAFREFLEQVHGDRLEFAAGRETYDQHHPALSLLPFAMALGLADSWYRRFEPVLAELARQGAVPTSGPYPWWAYGAGYGAVRTSYSSSTTSPSSSGGSGGSFGGGGAGSGGGGGGGGSW
ncbi:MAG: DUF2207 domain-containing protein [Actinobacteria bacterium]|jgi:uncharacterized membrane protein YgcG|nr:DUF2207 domain-containing protein [Actinomycetota bacterium]